MQMFSHLLFTFLNFSAQSTILWINNSWLDLEEDINFSVLRIEFDWPDLKVDVDFFNRMQIKLAMFASTWFESQKYLT